MSGTWHLMSAAQQAEISLQRTLWTSDEDAILRQGLADNLSFTQIGTLVNKSRGAVAGRITRLGLAPRIDAAEQSKRRYARRAKNPRVPPTPVDRSGDSAIEMRMAREAMLPRAVPVFRSTDAKRAFGEICTIIQLTFDSCRWPIGDPREPDFGYCNARANPLLPYCEHHCRVAYGA